MNYSELQNILANSTSEDWIHNEEHYIYKNDLNLRIFERKIDFDTDQFKGEDWATRHPDSEAYKVTFEVYYNASFIKKVGLVGVDGLRAMLPMPKIGTNQVDKASYNFAQIVNPDQLDKYMERSGLVVI